MAGQQRRQDPKEAALAATRCLNPHPEQVTDAEFLGSDFFDARDAVQVKYEMVRKVRAGGAPVTEAAAARKKENRSLPLLTSPGHAAAEPGARPDAGQATAPGGGLDARCEELRHAALHARAQAFPLGLGVLAGKGAPPGSAPWPAWPSRRRRRPGGCPAPPRPSRPGSPPR
jgi:hypothetical protein